MKKQEREAEVDEDFFGISYEMRIYNLKKISRDDKKVLIWLNLLWDLFIFFF